MASDSFTSVTSSSIFGRTRNAFVGFLIGPLLLVGAAVLIFWNESHSVRVMRSLKEGAATVQEAEASEFNPAQDSRLLHLNGETATDETLRDGQFGVEGKGVRLIRNVEVYEWTEKESSSKTSTSLTGTKTTTKTYNYETKWDKTLHNSSKFKQPAGHENPSELKYKTAQWEASKVTLGAYELDPVLVHKITNSEPVELSEDSLTLPDGAQLSDGKIYVGADPAKAEIGDLRISESMVPTGAVSVIAKQGPGTRLTPFHAKAGEDIGLVEPGTKSAEEMFLTAQSESRLLTWGLRACGFVLLFFGFLLFLGPISTMSSIIPFLGGLVEAGVFIISLLAAIAVWTLLVGMAWMVARPLLGGALLLLAIAAAFFLIRHMRKHAAAGRARAAA